MKLRFTPRAIENIEEIASYIRQYSPNAADRVRAAIYDSLQQLVLFPYLGRRQRAEGVRRIVTRRYPYLIYYLVDITSEEVVILNVKHAARNREHDDA